MKSVIVGTAGHIDHGKSALVLALTGTDPDRLKEEKARGITIDLGFAHLALGEIEVGFVDVPGHERFVKNMLAGVGGFDLVMLIVAADESVMPQTREHFEICRLLRIPAGIVVLTKADLVDADMLDLVRLEVRELVAGSFLEHAPVIPVSARTGAGLDELRGVLAASALRLRRRAIRGATRLPIDRVFSVKGFGTVVTGTLVSGSVANDDELVIEPGGQAAKVRGVQVHGAGQARAMTGQRTAVNLGGLEVGEVERGQNLVTPGSCTVTRTLEATIEVLPGARAIRHGARVRFHQGTAEILGRVILVGPVPVTGDGPREVPVVPAGGRAFIRIRLERESVLARGDRFILRAYSPAITIAGGCVLDPMPPRIPVRSEKARTRCEALLFDPGDDEARREADTRALAVMVADAGGAGLPVSAVVARVGVDPADVADRLAGLEARGGALRVRDILVAPMVLATLRKAIPDALRTHHAAQPLSEGMPREEVRERLFGRGAAEVFDRVVDELVAAGTIIARDRLALASHRLQLSPDDERVRGKVERAFGEAGLKPPDVASLSAAIGESAQAIERVVKLLLRQKTLSRLDTLLFHTHALDALKVTVRGLKAEGEAAPQIDVAMFKERFGLSRKYAIPLLEFLDRERVTRRVGDARVLIS